MGFRAARKKAGLSVVEVAEKTGVSRISIYGYEIGTAKPRADKLPTFAEVYRCTIEDLLAPEPKEDG